MYIQHVIYGDLLAANTSSGPSSSDGFIMGIVGALGKATVTVTLVVLGVPLYALIYAGQGSFIVVRDLAKKSGIAGKLARQGLQRELEKLRERINKPSRPVTRSEPRQPADVYDIKSFHTIEVASADKKKTLTVRGLLDTGAFPLSQKKDKNKRRYGGLIRREIVLALALEAQIKPYSGGGLSGFSISHQPAALPVGQIVLRWRLLFQKGDKEQPGSMKMYQKIFLAVVDTKAADIIIGMPAIRDAKIFKWNEEVLHIGSSPSHIHTTHKNPFDPDGTVSTDNRSTSASQCSSHSQIVSIIGSV